MTHKVKLMDGSPVEMYKVLVHEFYVAEFDDPILHAGKDFYDWEKTEKGQWVIERSISKPVWYKHLDHETYNYIFKVYANFFEKDYVEYCLKYN